jgi:hypothetical protein
MYVCDFFLLPPVLILGSDARALELRGIRAIRAMRGRMAGGVEFKGAMGSAGLTWSRGHWWSRWERSHPRRFCARAWWCDDGVYRFVAGPWPGGREQRSNHYSPGTTGVSWEP